MIMIGGRINFGVGVGVFVKMKIGGRSMIKPVVEVTEGTRVGVAVGRTGVGGATMSARESGMQLAIVTVFEIHAWPPSPPAN